MVYGGTETEEVQLNEETFCGGVPYRNDNPDALKVLPEVRKLYIPVIRHFLKNIMMY